jgi:AcrR family transcriptional regulator
MGRTGGEKTKQRILDAAETLFSRNGFHGTSVSEITKKAMVNKAALYYHFKDKNDLILALFQKILDDFADSGVAQAERSAREMGVPENKRVIREEISFLEKRKDIFAVLLMESFKSQDSGKALFQCMEVAVKSVPGMAGSSGRLVHEFFTGFVPLLAFAVLKDKWCEYFRCDKEQVLDQFVDSFMASHVETHPEVTEDCVG